MVYLFFKEREVQDKFWNLLGLIGHWSWRH